MPFKLTSLSGFGFAAPLGLLGQPNSDPDFDKVVLLVEWEGNDADTVATDLSNSAHALTFVGDAQIDTAAKKVGDSAVLFDGSGDRITAADSDDWDLGTEDFTIEAWFRQTGGSVHSAIIGRGTVSGSTRWLANINNVGEPGFISNGTNFLTYSVDLRDSVWHHYAVTRASDVLRLFIDGDLKDTDSTVWTGAGASQVLVIGADPFSSDSRTMTGSIDSLRFTKGLARYTSNFLPPLNPHALPPPPTLVPMMLDAPVESIIKPPFWGGVPLIESARDFVPESSLIRMPFWEGAGPPKSVTGDFNTTVNGSVIWTSDAGVGVGMTGFDTLSTDFVRMEGTNVEDHPVKPQFPHTIEIIFIPLDLGSDQILWCNDGHLTLYHGINIYQRASSVIVLSYGRGTGTSSSARKSYVCNTPLINGRIFHVIITARSITDVTIYVNGILQVPVVSGSSPVIKYSANYGGWGVRTRMVQANPGKMKMIYFDLTDYAYSEDFVYGRFLHPFAPLLVTP